jgi:hypothetical protein
MKRLLPILLAFLPIQSFEQAIDHFNSEASHWYVARVLYYETRSTNYGFIGDTLVNNEIWLKLYSSSDSSFNVNVNFLGYIHSSNNMVLYKDLSGNLDTIYNFNLNIGDSVFFDLGPKAQKIAINNIDSVIINGLYFNRFIFDEPIGPNNFTIFDERWIDGIGSIHGPLFPYEPGEFATEWPDEMDLTCSFSEGIQYWNNPSYNDCFINITLGLDDLSLTGYNIYPNPFKDFIIIENNNPKSDITDVEIFSIQGNKVFSVNLSVKKQRIILDYLPIGVYYIRINQNGSYITKAVVKLY